MATIVRKMDASHAPVGRVSLFRDWDVVLTWRDMLNHYDSMFTWPIQGRLQAPATVDER